MSLYTYVAARFIAVHLIVFFSIVGCSGSSDSQSPMESMSDATHVTFDITVPVIVSNELQVRLMWGDIDTTAMWKFDESWSVVDELPRNTENSLLVTFSDRNGKVTLGSFESDFRTGTTAAETVRITADQFDTGRWDNDGDGISNIDELIAGADPLISDDALPTSEMPQVILASLDLVADKTFRLSWSVSEGAEYYKILENPDGVSGFSPISGDLDTSTLSFDHRVALYDRANARYIVQACNSNGCTDSDEQIVTGNLESAIGNLMPSNTTDGGRGFKLSVSGDGSTLAVGTLEEVVVFVRSEGLWTEQTVLSGGANRGSLDGGALSLSADGNTLAVGSDSDTSAAIGINGDQLDPSIFEAGAVVIYVRLDNEWQQQAFVKASNPEAVDNFGSAVSLSANGNALVVGAPKRGSRDSGAAYVFSRDDGIWQEEAFLLASNEDQVDNFGSAVAMSGDGSTLAVGAPFEDSTATGVGGNQIDVEGSSASNSGAIYVFSRSGADWQQEAYVKASKILPNARFGSALGLSGSGDVLAVAGFRIAEVYSRSADGWEHQTSLPVGNSLSVSDDGRLIAVGNQLEDSAATGINGNQSDTSIAQSGAVFLYEFSDEGWIQLAYVKASNTSRNFFGRSISLSADGLTLAVGGLRRSGIQLY